MLNLILKQRLRFGPLVAIQDGITLLSSTVDTDFADICLTGLPVDVGGRAFHGHFSCFKIVM